MANSRSELLRNNAFSDVKRFEPERVKHTRRTRGDEAARKQQIAIALDQARRQGAKVPKP